MALEPMLMFDKLVYVEEVLCRNARSGQKKTQSTDNMINSLTHLKIAVSAVHQSIQLNNNYSDVENCVVNNRPIFFPEDAERIHLSSLLSLIILLQHLQDFCCPTRRCYLEHYHNSKVSREIYSTRTFCDK